MYPSSSDRLNQMSHMLAGIRRDLQEARAEINSLPVAAHREYQYQSSAPPPYSGKIKFGHACYFLLESMQIVSILSKLDFYLSGYLPPLKTAQRRDKIVIGYLKLILGCNYYPPPPPSYPSNGYSNGGYSGGYQSPPPQNPYPYYEQPPSRSTGKNLFYLYFRCRAIFHSLFI